MTSANGFNVSNASSPSTPARLGWQDSPNERGTMDIIWSCLSALALCMWTMLHLNVPAEGDGWSTIVWRRTRWLILGILAPELPMLVACGQYASAKRSVTAFENSGYTKGEWTLCHAFFADGGGFVLQPDHSRSFPITAKQLHYLVQKNHVSLPSISATEIQDKSKADGFVKLLAFVQAGWLMVETIARATEGLAVTPFELATIALTCTSLTTLGFWWHKPLDVQTPIVLRCKTSISAILREGGQAAKEPFYDTPLDFIEGRIYIAGKWSPYLRRCIRKCKLQDFPLTRIPDDRDAQANLAQHTILGIATAAFASIHFSGWNFDFASHWQMWLWRSSCAAVWILLCVYGLTEMAICYQEGYQLPGLESGGAYKMRWPHCLMFFVPATLYFMARLGLLVIAISTLTSLPATAYQDVQWTAMLPHI